MVESEAESYPRRSKNKTTARVANFTRVTSALPQVLHTILFVTMHRMYDLKRQRTDAECERFSKFACATGSFILPFEERMCNWTLWCQIERQIPQRDFFSHALNIYGIPPLVGSLASQTELCIFPLDLRIRNSTFLVLFGILSLCVRYSWVETIHSVRVSRKPYWCVAAAVAIL